MFTKITLNIYISLNLKRILGPNRVIARAIKSFTYYCVVRCAAIIVYVGGMPWSQIGATHYHAQLGLLDKGRLINGLVVCYVVWLGSMKGMGLRTCMVRMALVLK